VRLLLRLVVITAVAASGLAVSVTLIAPQLSRALTANHGTAEPINLNPLPERSLVFDRNGGLMATFHEEENRSPVHLDQVPHQVIRAILAVEDENFYHHNGVDLRGTVRALFENVSAGTVEQGGSTITMQVVKNSLLSPERDFERKIHEAILASRLEQQMSKDAILERYLNSVYLGNHAYGVQAAAETYFGKDVGELDWPEAALLAALIRAPAAYDPFANPDLALERRRLALQRLVETRDLSQSEADLYSFTPLPVAPHVVIAPPKDYFIEEVKQALLDDPRLGATETERYNALFKGGLRIYTTFDPAMQLQAIAARNTILPGDGSGVFYITHRRDSSGHPLPDAPGTASVVSVEPPTGAIRAMVGGPGFDNYQFNIATQSLRQPGSSMKVYVLAAALEHGYVLNDTINGTAPCSFENPGGVPDPYVVSVLEGGGGMATLQSQLAHSVNCAFVRLGIVVGQDNVIEQARRMGVTAPLAPELSLPLGSFGISPLEQAGAYASIANDGIYNKPYYIQRVTDSVGNLIFEHQPDGHRAMSVQTARQLAQAMQQVVTGGTGTRARLSGRQVAGKTGTAQDYHDAWFVGMTPQLATAVWMGSWIGEVPMRGVGGINVFGGTFPARIWQNYMSAALTNQPVLEFTKPAGTRAGKLLETPADAEKRKKEEVNQPAGGNTTPPTGTVITGPPTTRRPRPSSTTTTA
jgi:penicillin-binding protein 1A